MRRFFLISITLLALSTELFSKTYHWRKGTTFLSFLRNNGISQKLYYELDSQDKELLEEIRVGQSYTVTKKKKTKTILIPITDEIQVKIVKKYKNRAKISLEPIPYKVVRNSIYIKVKKSIYSDLYKKTHSMTLVRSLKRAYRSLDLHKMKRGDILKLIYEQHIRKGKTISSPKLLASLVTIKGKKYYSYLADDGRYYDSLGKEYRTIKKTFIPYLRPISINRCRISSCFTRRRFHPILHRYRAHLGVDYAARRGTPIRATANGRIIKRGRKGGYGNCIIIQHKHGLRSLYAHMSRYRRGLRVGSRVKQGTVIGYVGTTGRSTGPHLHFGMYKYRRAVNPARYVRVKKHQEITNRLKGKEYRKLRKKVVFFRKKFAQIKKVGNYSFFVRNETSLIRNKKKRG